MTIKVGDWIMNNDSRYPQGPFEVLELEQGYSDAEMRGYFWAVIQGPYRKQRIRLDRIYEDGRERYDGYNKVKV